ncbi:MAG: amidohydrolase family protein [Pseudomonadota bacterium]
MDEPNVLRRAFTIAAGCLVALALGAAIFLPTPDPDKRAGALAITNALAFDGEFWWEDATLLIENGRVVALGSEVGIPTHARTIDVGGATILPGLIDAHVHSYGDALTQQLRFGVTTVLDMFTAPGSLPASRDARDSLAPSSRADRFSAGMLATVAGGHGSQFGVPIEAIDASTDIEKWVADRLSEGSDYIKLVYIPYQRRLPSLTLATAKTLIDAAHDAGVMAVAHVSSGRGAQDMVAAGADGLVHIWADKPVDDAFIDAALAADIFVIPTLAVFATAERSGEGVRLAEDPNFEDRLTDAQAASLRSDFGLRIPGMRLQAAIDNTRRLHDAGIPILAGSDAPNPGTAHGPSLHHELELLVRAGLSPAEALSAATVVPAERFNLQGRGELTEEARADFIVVDGDPREDPTATRALRHVFKNGADIPLD